MNIKYKCVWIDMINMIVFFWLESFEIEKYYHIKCLQLWVEHQIEDWMRDEGGRDVNESDEDISSSEIEIEDNISMDNEQFLNHQQHNFP